jgi:hypothetical protein
VDYFTVLRNRSIHDLRDLYTLLGMLMLPAKKEKETIAWSTDSEIEYINQIGTFRPDNKDRITFLRGYIAAIPNRIKWAGMDKMRIVKHAGTLLQENLDRELC